jgi:hypothetical protein
MEVTWSTQLASSSRERNCRKCAEKQHWNERTIIGMTEE